MTHWMRYRYRSSVLLGAWHMTAEKACADAIRAKQAYRNPDGTITWQGNAMLEAAAEGGTARRAS